MKFSAVAAAAFVAGAQAASNVTYTTEVVTAYTTYCPAATQITHNGETYTVTEATTLTITNCPCTISKPVYSTSAPAAPSSYPVSSAMSSAMSSAVSSYPVSAPGVSSSAAVTSAKPTAPVYPTGANSTIATVPATKSSVGTTSATVVPSGTGSTPVPTAGAGKAAALSGAGLAGVLGLVAYVL